MTSLVDLAVAAIERHSHYYTDAVGWLLRAQLRRYSYTIDADREEYGTTAPQLELYAFPVVRWTPCGATIRDIWSRGGTSTRFCDLRDGRKQYASRTAQEAVRQLVGRRRRMIWVLSKKVERAQEDISTAERTLNQ